MMSSVEHGGPLSVGMSFKDAHSSGQRVAGPRRPIGDPSSNVTFGERVPASLAGFVYLDANNDGVKQGRAACINGVFITLTGTDALGNPVNLIATTASGGAWSFTNLRPSSAAGYTITKSLSQ